MAAFFVPDEAAVAVDLRVGEAEPDGPVQVHQRLVEIPSAVPHDGPVMVEEGIVRVDVDRRRQAIPAHE